MLKIEIDRNGQVQNVVLKHLEIIIGSRNEEREVDLDLSPDDSVSRVHARVWVAEGRVHIEVLESKAGTLVDG